LFRARESAAMRWLESWGIPVPECELVLRSTESTWAPAFGPPWVVKPDVPLGGKGLSGLVEVCQDHSELLAAMTNIRKSGAFPNWTEELPLIVEEFIQGPESYMSISLDDGTCGAVMRFSAEGGVGFDAMTQSDAVSVPLSFGLMDSHIQSLLRGYEPSPEQATIATLRSLMRRLWNAFAVSEATLLEINPLKGRGNDARCVGVALEFDEGSVEDVGTLRPKTLLGGAQLRSRPITDREAAVIRADMAQPDLPSVTYSELEGDVALLVSGGGAGLLCLDYLWRHGCQVGCYIDSSPGAGPEKRLAQLHAGLSMTPLRGILFGAVVVSLENVSAMCAPFIQAFESLELDATQVPVVARVAGPGEEEAHALLASRIPGLVIVDRRGTLEDACDRLIQEMYSRSLPREAAVLGSVGGER